MATVTIVCSANETLRGYVRICIAGCQKPCSNVFVSKNTGAASYRPVKNTFYLNRTPSCRESEMLNFIQSSPLLFLALCSILLQNLFGMFSKTRVLVNTLSEKVPAHQPVYTFYYTGFTWVNIL